MRITWQRRYLYVCDLGGTCCVTSSISSPYVAGDPTISLHFPSDPPKAEVTQAHALTTHPRGTTEPGVILDRGSVLTHRPTFTGHTKRVSFLISPQTSRVENPIDVLSSIFTSDGTSTIKLSIVTSEPMRAPRSRKTRLITFVLFAGQNMVVVICVIFL